MKLCLLSAFVLVATASAACGPDGCEGVRSCACIKITYLQKLKKFLRALLPANTNWSMFFVCFWDVFCLCCLFCLVMPFCCPVAFDARQNICVFLAHKYTFLIRFVNVVSFRLNFFFQVLVYLVLLPQKCTFVKFPRQQL